MANDPDSFFELALKKIPQLKWALWVIGVCAAAMIIIGFTNSAAVGIFGFILVFLGMIALFIFSKLILIANNRLNGPILALIWTVCLSLIIIVTLLISSSFFNGPLPLKDLLLRSINTSGQSGGFSLFGLRTTIEDAAADLQKINSNEAIILVIDKYFWRSPDESNSTKAQRHKGMISEMSADNFKKCKTLAAILLASTKKDPLYDRSEKKATVYVPWDLGGDEENYFTIEFVFEDEEIPYCWKINAFEDEKSAALAADEVLSVPTSIDQDDTIASGTIERVIRFEEGTFSSVHYLVKYNNQTIVVPNIGMVMKRKEGDEISFSVLKTNSPTGKSPHDITFFPLPVTYKKKSTE